MEMDPVLKKVFIVIAMVVLVIVLVAIIIGVTKKDSPKKEETKIEDKKGGDDEGGDIDVGGDEGDDGGDIELPKDDIVKVIRCTYEGEEHNVIWENSTATFHIDENNQVLIFEDVREYKFDKTDTEEFINNQTLDVISKVLNGVKGVQSTLTTINQEEHTYRFSTVYDYRELDKDALYNFYYKRFYNTDDIYMSREQFDKKFESQEINYMKDTFLRSGYECES